MTNDTSTDVERPDALEVRGVAGGYYGAEVVRGVSLRVPRGKVVALLGPNGAGKTTVLRLMSGVLRPKSGQVFLDGEDVTQLSPHARAHRGLCYIPEGRAIYPSLTVRDNVVLHAPRGEAQRYVDGAVDAFPVLGTRLESRAATLSGGQQQMLALVPAFVSNPKVVLVDEASFGLAPILVDVIFERLSELARRGTSTLVVEQYVKRALALADMAYILTQGEIKHSGPAQDLGEIDLLASYLGA
jgi:branched-chain amino acid transport system ATP-binding protein